MSDKVTSPLFMDNADQNLGNSPGDDGRGRLHTKIANDSSEPIPVNSVADLLTSTGLQSQINVGTTPVPVRVGSSNLVNRKLVFVQPVNGKVRVGFSGIAPALGVKLFKDQFFALPVADTLDFYVVAESGTVDVTIGEGA